MKKSGELGTNIVRRGVVDESGFIFYISEYSKGNSLSVDDYIYICVCVYIYIHLNLYICNLSIYLL